MPSIHFIPRTARNVKNVTEDNPSRRKSANAPRSASGELLVAPKQVIASTVESFRKVLQRDGVVFFVVAVWLQ